MAEQKFNAIEGFSVGANATPIADSNANIQANNLSSSGNVSFTGPNVSLGNVANLEIAGGSNGQAITTDGAGNLVFSTINLEISAAPMPIVIDSGNTLTIAANYQGLFAVPLVVDGTLEVDGVLADVSGQGAAGTDTQVTFNDEGNPSGNNGFTFLKSSGNLNVPGSFNAGSFIKCATYSEVELRTITGVIGQLAAVNNSNPIGMPAFWDGTNNRWSYIHDNSAV